MIKPINLKNTMKLTKNDLKQIVKECLVEILSEGMGSSIPAVNEVKKQTLQKKPMTSTSSVMRQTAERTRMPSAALKEAIKVESGGNPIMASILADTAANSLPSMLESDTPGKFSPAPTGTAERVVAASAPEDLFGEEAASRWANLAFAALPKK